MKRHADAMQWASLLLLAGALGCAISFRSIGSRVGPDGVLHEPFALIPIGYALAAGSVATLALSLMSRPRRP